MSDRLDEMSDRLGKWERDFRAAARADNYVTLRGHLWRLMLPDKPKLMVEGTISVVRASSAYLAIDGRKKDFPDLLDLQTYDPTKATNARYAFTFNMFGKAFARVLLDARLEGIDLADLYGSPWFEYRVVGFRYLWISHPDWSHLTKKEMKELKAAVTYDLRYDYSELEVRFWFNEDTEKSYLLVTVEDVEWAKDPARGRRKRPQGA